MNILLIEDDFQLSTAIETFLELQKFKVEVVDDGESAIDIIDKLTHDLYIIDINLPSVNGLEITKYIRQKNKQTPIIMITASIEVDNFLQAHEFGCSEYIKKPFHLKELEVLINKTTTFAKDKLLHINDSVSFNMNDLELFVDGKSVQLRKKERKFLNILLQNKNHIVDNEKIIDYVWENDIREQYPLRQLVSELRKKFPNANQYIKTSIGSGYKIEVAN